MTRDDFVWVVVFATGIGYEVWAIRREQYDKTMSRTTRRWWRTHHPVGATAFSVGWMGFAGWFAWHVVKGSEPWTTKTLPGT